MRRRAYSKLWLFTCILLLTAVLPLSAQLGPLEVTVTGKTPDEYAVLRATELSLEQSPWYNPLLAGQVEKVLLPAGPTRTGRMGDGAVESTERATIFYRARIAGVCEYGGCHRGAIGETAGEQLPGSFPGRECSVKDGRRPINRCACCCIT